MNEQENKFAALTEQELQEINGGADVSFGPIVNNGQFGFGFTVKPDK